jgi:hypothetical protein
LSRWKVGDIRRETDMDSSFTIKPNAPVAKFTARERHERNPDHVPHDVVVDPESREVINRENDVRAHAHEREHPDQALLRYRAYRPARSESDNTVSIEPHANIKA